MENVIVNKNGVKFITFSKLNDIPFVKHGFSTKIGGISNGIYDSLNLGFKNGDTKTNITENIKRFTNAVGLDYMNLVISDQTHGNNIKVIRSGDKGKGFFRERDYSNIDGLVTNIKGIPLMTMFADCVPIFMVDTVKQVIAVSHAGWKGTKLKIGKKTVHSMIHEYGSNPKDIIAVIGPSIGKCCYEVDKKVVDEFNKNFNNTSEFISAKEKSKYKLNLWNANKIALKEAGLIDKNIMISNLCTSCNSDLFFSYRKEKGQTGRMGAIIQLI